MNEYEYKVTLTVRVEAYDQNDAREIIDETFGVGDDGGLVIESSTVKYVKNNSTV